MSRAAELIARDLANLGVARGDTLLVLADVRYLRLPREPDGKRPRNNAKELLDGLQIAVGESGTLMFLTFTKLAWKALPVGDAPYYDRTTEPSTGSLAKLATQQPDASRSEHPSNSVTAIGERAQELVRFHSPASFSSRPIETLIDLGGKMLTIGCIHTNPGFSTVHLAQYHLGLSTRTLLRNRGVARYRDPLTNRPVTFTRRDISGCSMGFGKMYDVYRAAGILEEGLVARAPSMLIDSGSAYKLDYATLQDDPESLLCDNPECKFCRGLITYGTESLARFWFAEAKRQARGRGTQILRDLRERASRRHT